MTSARILVVDDEESLRRVVQQSPEGNRLVARQRDRHAVLSDRVEPMRVATEPTDVRQRMRDVLDGDRLGDLRVPGGEYPSGFGPSPLAPPAALTSETPLHGCAGQMT